MSNYKGISVMLVKGVAITETTKAEPAASVKKSGVQVGFTLLLSGLLLCQLIIMVPQFE